MIDGKKLIDLIISRQSDRNYSNEPVTKEQLDRILEAGRMAPSACNSQLWKFIVVTDHDLIGKVADAAAARLTGMNSFVGQAPLLLVVVREQANLSSKVGGTIKRKDYSLIDIGIASGNICLQSQAEGLGSCIVGWFDEGEVRKILGIPRSKRVELIITIGHSLNQQKEKKRKPPEQTVSYNKY
jgi:nitroreductase